VPSALNYSDTSVLHIHLGVMADP